MRWGWLYGTSVVLLVCSSGLAQGLDDLDSDWDAVLLLSPPAEPSAEGSDDVDNEDQPKQRGKKRRRGKRAGPAPKRARADGYAALKDSWHAPPPEDGSWGNEATGPVLVLRTVGKDEPYVLTAESEEGGFDDADIALASEALGTWEGGPSAHPRLLDLLYRATREFGVPYVHVVSGIRRDRSGSRHSHGLAVDVVFPGIKDDDLAAFFRAQGFVGVGTYTRAGFVHIDVREQSYFWIDRSPPGKRYKIQQVRGEEGREADAAAMARGEGPIDNPAPLQKALDQRGARRAKANKHKKKRARSGD